LKIEKIINDELSKGNEFAEIYVEERVTSSITIRSKRIVQEGSLRGRGMGVRTACMQFALLQLAEASFFTLLQNTQSLVL
jgi:predicted Zn-dependent protease